MKYNQAVIGSMEAVKKSVGELLDALAEAANNTSNGDRITMGDGSVAILNIGVKGDQMLFNYDIRKGDLNTHVEIRSTELYNSLREKYSPDEINRAFL